MLDNELNSGCNRLRFQLNSNPWYFCEEKINTKTCAHSISTLRRMRGAHSVKKNLDMCEFSVAMPVVGGAALKNISTSFFI